MRIAYCLFVGAIIIIALSMFVLTSTVGTVFHHPRYPGERFVIRDRAIIYAAHSDARPGSGGETSASGPQRIGTPRAVTTEVTYDFGIMNPLSNGQHQFVIQNQGQGPLQLSVAETTCQCAVGKLGHRVVPAGGRTTLEIQWNTGNTEKQYSHGALLRTNDPQRQHIWFKVEGSVRRRLMASPDELVLGRIAPGETAEASTIIFSDVWNRFEIDEIQSSLPELDWTIEPATEQQRESMAFTSAWQLNLRLPENLPEGHFQHWLRAKIVPPKGEPEWMELVISGLIIKRLSVHGRHIDQEGVIRLGSVDRRQGISTTLLVKVNDPQPDLGSASVTVQPDYVLARIEPFESATASGTTTGLYRLTLEIPAHVSSDRGEFWMESGQVRVEAQHPRIQSLEMKLEFSMTD